MKLWDIVKNVGALAFSSAVPGGSLILGAVNSFLPDDKKLPEGATGDDVSKAINTLPPEQQSEVLMKEFDVKIEEIKQSHNSLQTMLKANAESKHTTRPKIAYQSFQILAFSVVVVITVWAYAIITGDAEIITIINDSYLFIGVLVAPLVTVLHASFGVLTQESENRLNDAQGHKVDPVGGLISKLFKK